MFEFKIEKKHMQGTSTGNNTKITEIKLITAKTALNDSKLLKGYSHKPNFSLVFFSSVMMLAK